VTAKQIDSLAGSLQQLSGYDDEAIQSAENLLLTFTNVRNVTGKNNDVFNQASKSVLDLSRRFDQDLSASAVQLGKALNDPVRGVTALRRVGVSFSAQQQKLISRLVRTGHVLEAQKVILREVRTETGGAAAAYGKTLPGQLDILQGSLANLGATLLTQVNPQLKTFFGWLNKKIQDPDTQRKAKQVGTWIGTWGTGLKIEADFAEKQAKRAIRIVEWFNNAKVTPFGIFGGDGKRTGDFGPGQRTPYDPTYDLPDYDVHGMPRKRRPTGAKPPGTDAAERARLAKLARQRRARMTGLRNTWFDAMIGRELVNVQDITTIKGQIARLKEISAQITARIAVTKDITRKLNLEDQVKEVGRRRKGLQDDLAQAQKDARDANKERRLARRELALDWLDFNVEKAQATKTLKDDLKREHERIAAIQKQIKETGLTISLARRLFSAQQDLKETMKADPLAGLMQVSSSRLAAMLAAGTGLGVAGRRILRSNIAGAEIQPVYVGVNIDGREIGRAVTKDQARTSRRTARQTSGFRG